MIGFFYALSLVCLFVLGQQLGTEMEGGYSHPGWVIPGFVVGIISIVITVVGIEEKYL